MSVRLLNQAMLQSLAIAGEIGLVPNGGRFLPEPQCAALGLNSGGYGVGYGPPIP
jgi:hypothetical protein